MLVLQGLDFCSGAVRISARNSGCMFDLFQDHKIRIQAGPNGHTFDAEIFSSIGIKSTFNAQASMQGPAVHI